VPFVDPTDARFSMGQIAFGVSARSTKLRCCQQSCLTPAANSGHL
jgi:hypothetical protein